jgi:predicted DNA-binding protein
MKSHQESRKQKVTVKLPNTWVEQLEALSQATGRSQNELLSEAIGRYLGQDDSTASDSTVSDRLQKLEQELSDLRQTVDQLVQAQAFASLARSTQPAMEPSRSSEDSDDDEIEDEPDEILYSFLEPGQ